MFLDDDDEFIGNKIDAQIKRLEELDKSWGACYTNYLRKKDGKTIAYSAENREGDLLIEELMRNLFVHAGSNLMLRRDVVSEVKGFDESIERNQDVEFLSRVLMKYKLAYVDELGLIVHVNSREHVKENFESITEDYINKFYKNIMQLPNKEINKIKKMINLQLVRNFLTTKGKRHKVIPHLRKKNIPFSLFLRYLFYLIKRGLTKNHTVLIYN